METVAIVLAIVSIVLAAVAIITSIRMYIGTKDTLSNISEKAAVTQSTVQGAQKQLLDTVTEIAKPQRETEEATMMRTMLPVMMQDPKMRDGLAQIMRDSVPDQDDTGT